jgi:HK97 family phage major capsid protein
MSDPQAFLTPDQVKEMVTSAVTEAIKAVNTVADSDRPEATKSVAIHPRRQRTPRLGRALKAMYTGSWAGAELERDVSLATKEAFDLGTPEHERGFHWVQNANEAYAVFDHMGDKDAAKWADEIAPAVKAMDESGSYALTGGTAGGILVPPQFLQSLFAYALSPRVAVRRVAGIRVMPVVSNNVRLPRETTRAGASQSAEAGTLSAADAVLGQQSINIEKQYAYRLFSNELMDDADPSFMEFLSNTVLRDLSIQQDIQYLRGTGSTPQIQGLIGYTGITSGPSLGTNGRTPIYDDLIESQYLLEDANSGVVDFLICHPRFVNTLRKLKDAQGRYLVNGAGTPSMLGKNAADVVLTDEALPAYKTTNLSRTLTVGSSTDCTTVILGDSEQVLLLERKGVELAISRDIAFNTDQTAVRAIGRSAIAILQPAAVSTIVGIRP